jgi:hypothetical protein
MKMDTKEMVTLHIEVADISRTTGHLITNTVLH